MNEKQEVEGVVSRMEEVFPQMYFLVGFLISLICGLATCFLCHFFIARFGSATAVVMCGLWLGFVSGLLFGFATLSDVLAGSIVGFGFGFGLGVAHGLSGFAFGICFALGIVVGFAVGYGLRRAHYTNKEIDSASNQNLPKAPFRIDPRD